MAQAQSGNKEAFACLLTEIADYMRPYFGRKMGGMDQAEDVLQETLLTIYRARHTYDPTRPFVPWLYAVANSRLMEFWRKHKRSVEKEMQLSEAQPELWKAEEEISKFEVAVLKTAIESLSDSQQEIVRLIKLEGKSIKEVAKQLDMSEAAVKVAAHRGYKKIYEAFYGA